MSVSKSAITYAVVALMVLWVLLGAITLPNANRWFKGSDYSVREDIISFNSSEANQTLTIENAVTERNGDRLFISNVYAIDNTPEVPSNGLQGVLYDLGEACGNDPKVIPISNFVQRHNISKIALIRQSTTCYLADKILYAQKYGAVGAIVFHNLSATDDPSANYDGMGIMSKTVEIPAYYVDLNAGLTFLKDLQNLVETNKNRQQQGYVDLMVRVVLSPNSKPLLDHWQFAIIIVAIMLITSILAITVLQCHMWHMAQYRSFNEGNNETLTADEQRQLAIDENYWRGIIGQPPQPLNIPMQKRRKQRLDQAIVDTLPTRIYKEHKNQDETNRLLNKEEPKAHNNNMSIDSFGTTCELSSCVICLESFSSGDVLRRLPCNHEYHRDCIDVWLTKKSGTCPLCQQIIEIPTVPDEIHAREEEEERMYEHMPDLAETWTGLARDEQIMMRQSPWVSFRNNNQRERENRNLQEDDEHVHFNSYPPL